MKPQTYLITIIISFSLSWIIFVLAALYQIGAPTSDSTGIYEFYKIKSNFAKSITNPELAIVAGSNALFGISSHLITQETGIPALNAGVNAGLGTDYILHQAKKLVKPGDTVILPLEYQLYMADSDKASDVLVDYIFAHDSKYLLMHPSMIMKLSLPRLVTGIIAKIHIPQQSKGEYYDPSKLNASGDATNNLEANITANMRKKTDRITPAIRIKGIPTYNSSGFKSIKLFAAWCLSQKIRLIATWPNTIWFDIYKLPKYQKFFQAIEKFYQDIGVPVLGKYSDFMYDESMFFDTYYHLNDRGVRHRTRQTINLLRPYLKQMVVPESIEH